jgi:hypothetical protein
MGKFRRKWEEIITANLKEIGYHGVDYTFLAQWGGRGGSFEHGNEPSASKKGGEFLYQLSESKTPVHHINYKVRA